MSVSIITLLWRNEAHSSAFMASLAEALAGASSVQVELILVTNGPDGLAAEAVCRRCIEQDRGWASVTVRWIALPVNTGFTGGVNTAVDHVQGEIIVVANHDLVFAAGFLCGLSSLNCATTPAFGLPIVRTGAHDDDAEARCSLRATVRTAFRNFTHREKRSGNAEAPIVSGACIVMNRLAVEWRLKTNGSVFDPEFHSYFEDLDLFWAARNDDVAMVSLPSARVTHLRGGSVDGKVRYRDRDENLQCRLLANYRLTVFKNARTSLDWLGYLVGEALAAIRQALHGLAGLRIYVASWSKTITDWRAIRRRLADRKS